MQAWDTLVSRCPTGLSSSKFDDNERHNVSLIKHFAYEGIWRDFSTWNDATYERRRANVNLGRQKAAWKDFDPRPPAWASQVLPERQDATPQHIQMAESLNRISEALEKVRSFSVVYFQDDMNTQWAVLRRNVIGAEGELDNMRSMRDATGEDDTAAAVFTQAIDEAEDRLDHAVCNVYSNAATRDGKTLKTCCPIENARIYIEREGIGEQLACL